MPKITYVLPDGTSTIVDASEETLMSIAAHPSSIRSEHIHLIVDGFLLH
jgi:hypothetical protein